MKDRIPVGSYTFADFFKMATEIDAIVAHFGFAFEGKLCDLPSRDVDAASVGNLRQRIEESLPFLGLGNDTARREFLISPVLLETVRHTHAKLRAEVPIEVDDQTTWRRSSPSSSRC